MVGGLVHTWGLRDGGPSSKEGLILNWTHRCPSSSPHPPHPRGGRTGEATHVGVMPHTGLKAEVESRDDEVSKGTVSQENWGVKADDTGNEFSQAGGRDKRGT